MKIAVLVGKFPLLSETFVLNQITGLLDRGHQVDIFALWKSSDNKVHPDVIKYRLLDKCVYRDISDNYPLRILHTAKKLFSNKEHFGKLIQSTNFIKYGNIALSFNLFYTCLQFLEREPYDIIFCHFGTIGNIGSALQDIGLAKGKLVVVFHGADMSIALQQNKNIYHRLFQNGDLFLPISQYWKEKLISLGCKEEKILVHRMGIDVNNFSYKKNQLKGNEKIRICTVARLVEKKGVEYAIKAVSSIAKKRNDIEYHIVGSGPLEKPLKQLISSLGMESVIKLHGWKTQDEVAQLLDKTNIFLSPSVTASDGDQEGIPVVLMEALAKGIPVVSTIHSGIPELIKDGISGYLVPERDIQALIDKIKILIDQPEDWQRMGMEGRKFVDENYNIDKLNDRLVSIFQGIIRSS